MDYAVVLRVQVRRFFCSNTACARITFSEAFADLTTPYARRTNRQISRLRAIAQELGGRPAARESETVQMPVSRHTMLRLLRRTPVPAAPTPRILGVDDWSVRKGAPQAHQVTDRFHLLLTLQEALKRLFERNLEALQEEADQQHGFLKPAAASERPAQALALSLTAQTPTAIGKQARRARRLKRYEEVVHLYEQGANHITIAALTGLNRATVRRYLTASGFPEIMRPGKRSHLDPYKDYLQQRWAAGERNVKHLLVELRERGYRQGETIVYDYLRTLREPQEGVSASVVRKKAAVRSAAQAALSAREAAWLCVCNPQKLRLSQAVRLDHLRVTNEDLELTYQLAQDFRVMVTKRHVHVLGRWLEEAKASDIKELQSLATGIYRDFDAVQAAVATEYSNGQTEGKVNKLKCIKRQLYGRATFDLLRQPMLLCG